MELPTAHCSDAQLSSYARRTLPWHEVLHIDRHLQQCPACADRLAQRAEIRRAGAVLRPVVREEAHLSYEQLEALAEGRSAPVAGLEAHVQRCRMCRSELDELKSFVGSFRLPACVIERPSVWDSIRQWVVQPLRLSAAAAGVVALAVGVGLLSRGGLDRNGGPLEIANTSAVRSVGNATARPLLFEDCGERELAAGSPEWLELYRRGDYGKLASALKGPAQQGNRAAQTALGLLSAAGLGTERNLTTARAWLGRAAARGDTCAQRTLNSLE
jgi:hypothetical protein